MCNYIWWKENWVLNSTYFKINFGPEIIGFDKLWSFNPFGVRRMWDTSVLGIEKTIFDLQKQFFVVLYREAKKFAGNFFKYIVSKLFYEIFLAARRSFVGREACLNMYSMTTTLVKHYQSLRKEVEAVACYCPRPVNRTQCVQMNLALLSFQHICTSGLQQSEADKRLCDYAKNTNKINKELSRFITKGYLATTIHDGS